MNKNKPAGFHCNGCTKRTIGCHSNCKEYLDDKAEYERLKAIRDEGKEARKYTNLILHDRMDRLAKKTKRTKPNIVK